MADMEGMKDLNLLCQKNDIFINNDDNCRAVKADLHLLKNVHRQEKFHG